MVLAHVLIVCVEGGGGERVTEKWIRFFLFSSSNQNAIIKKQVSYLSPGSP